MNTELKSFEWLEKNYNELYMWMESTFNDLMFTAIDEITDADRMVIINIFTKTKSFNISASKPDSGCPKGYIGLTYTNRSDGKGRDLEEASYTQNGWKHILGDLLDTDNISLDDLLAMLKKRNS